MNGGFFCTQTPSQSEFMEVYLWNFSIVQLILCRPSLWASAERFAYGAASIFWRDTGRTTRRAMLEEYLTRDKLVKIMLDKDNMIKTEIVPTDEDYYIKCPTERKFDDCCNEFWNVATYVSKGLLRGEILFAIDHMNEVLRHELLRMISWYVGTEKGFNFSLGKNYKFLDKHISKELWDNLLNTYSMSSYEEMWKSFDLCLCLFKKISKKVADSLGYNYPDYDENVTKYLETQKRISNKYLYGNRY